MSIKCFVEVSLVTKTTDIDTKKIFIGIKRVLADQLQNSHVGSYVHCSVRFIGRDEYMDGEVTHKKIYDDGVLMRVRPSSVDSVLARWPHFYVWIPKVGNAGILCNW